MELHQGLPQLLDEGIKLYAISYDDVEALADYTRASGVSFTMLSDVDSAVIQQFGVLNTIVQPNEAPFFGIPFPGLFLLNEDGVIVDKLFNRHLANRDGVEAILDSFLGRIEPGQAEPMSTFTEDDGIEITAFLRGGNGVLRIGPKRRLVVRVTMPDGLHIYDNPVPEGMVATSIELSGPEGLRFETTTAPLTSTLTLPGVSDPLPVWSGTVDFVTPLHGDSTLGQLFRDNSEPSVEIAVKIRYQACDDAQCFIPVTRTLQLEVPLERGPMPGFKMMKNYGGEVLDMDSKAHMLRLIARGDES